MPNEKDASPDVQSRLLVATPSDFAGWVERAFLEGADGGDLAQQAFGASRQIFAVEGERRYLAGVSTRSGLPYATQAQFHHLWVDEVQKIDRIAWNRLLWESEDQTVWIETPPQKQMTALEVICRNAHWTRPLGGMLVIGNRGMCLPFAVGPVSLVPEPADHYAALCGCCRMPVGFAATEVVPDTEWMD